MTRFCRRKLRPFEDLLEKDPLFFLIHNHSTTLIDVSIFPFKNLKEYVILYMYVCPFKTLQRFKK